MDQPEAQRKHLAFIQSFPTSSGPLLLSGVKSALEKSLEKLGKPGYVSVIHFHFFLLISNFVDIVPLRTSSFVIFSMIRRISNL